MRKLLASQQQPDKYGYLFDTEAFTMSTTVSHHFRMYETYGDGLCQHSGDWPITNEYFADYLASLATAMLADESGELLQAVSCDLTRAPGTEGM